jgi:HEAT repeat protein
MFALIADVVIILTLAVIVLSVFAVLSRYLSDLRERRIRQIRERMQGRLDEFLADSADAKAIIHELSRDPDIALGVLIGAASKLSCDARMPLRVLFEQFQFPQKATAGLRARRWATRVRAATQLGYMSHDDAIPELVKALEDDILDVRLAAAHALAQLGAVQAVRPILRSLALPAAWPLQRCAEILYGMGAKAIDPLLDFLKDQDPQDQNPAVVAAVRVLGMLRARRAAPQVSDFLRSTNPELRLNSAKALGQMGDPQVVSALCTSLDDPVWEVRSAAAQALGHLGNPSAMPSLEKLLADSAWWARFNAAESLFQLGQPGQNVLKQAMAGHPDTFARDISRQILEEHGVIPMQEVFST